MAVSIILLSSFLVNAQIHVSEESRCIFVTCLHCTPPWLIFCKGAFAIDVRVSFATGKQSAAVPGYYMLCSQTLCGFVEVQLPVHTAV